MRFRVGELRSSRDMQYLEGSTPLTAPHMLDLKDVDLKRFRALKAEAEGAETQEEGGEGEEGEEGGLEFRQWGAREGGKVTLLDRKSLAKECVGGQWLFHFYLPHFSLHFYPLVFVFLRCCF